MYCNENCQIVTPFCVHHTMETPIMHLEKITIMTPKVSHSTMHSPYTIPTSQAQCLTIQNMSNIPCSVHCMERGLDTMPIILGSNESSILTKIMFKQWFFCSSNKLQYVDEHLPK
jgi:hypothetical protein